MKTIRKRIMLQSNPKKTIATVTFHGRSHKEAARNTRALVKKFHLLFEADVKRARAKSRAKARAKSRRKRR